MSFENRLFLCSYWLYPLLFLAIASTAIYQFKLDQLLADYFYSLQGHHWAWKNSWLTEQLLHKGGRSLSLMLALTVFFYAIVSCFNSAQKVQRRPLLYLLLASAGSSLLVSVLKSSLAISCPWEFERYGGHLVYSDVVQQLFLRNGAGCFPAGHASAGYAWVALYFFGLCYQSRWRWTGLSIGLFAGCIFGLAQQLRGAHFISHDLWTLAICWFFSLSLYQLMFNKNI